MSEFQLYTELGLAHILDMTAYDHIVFVIALCAIYQFKDWRKVLVLVTAFTIGHSLTLALATLDVVVFSSRIIEILIPITILITALVNVLRPSKEIAEGEVEKKGTRKWFKYGLALFFGFIHGMGFSNYLRALLEESDSLVMPLFAFNIGLEIGQIAIVLSILSIAYIVISIGNAKAREWNLFISGLSFGIASVLLLNLLLG